MAELLRQHKFHFAHLARERIDRALMQLTRVELAHQQFERVASDVRGWLPPEAIEPQQRLDDEVYFLAVATAQALRARRAMEDLGEPMPPVRNAEAWTAWRNVGEHWDDLSRDRPVSALRRWADLSRFPEPGLHRSSDSYGLRTLSGLNIRELREDLDGLVTAVSQIEEHEWHRCFLTASEAAEVLGVSEQAFLSRKRRPPHTDFGPSGIRYWSDWVEAERDGLDQPAGWSDVPADLQLHPDETGFVAPWP